MRLIVVGNGMVGQRLTEALRARDTKRHWQVTVLAEERRPAYDRVRLSAYFDGVSEEDLSYDTPDGVELRLGDPALAIDPAGRKVFTAQDVYSYDALVLATGSYPFVPPVDGAHRPGVFTYRTLDDLEAIREYARAIPEDSSGRRVGAVIVVPATPPSTASSTHTTGCTTTRRCRWSTVPRSRRTWASTPR